MILQSKILNISANDKSGNQQYNLKSNINL